LKHHWPGVPILGDIHGVTADTLRGLGIERVDLLTGGPPCFAAGTMVLTEEGYRPIEELKVGDEVLTHTGKWQPITAVMVREDAPLLDIAAGGVPHILTTYKHPFYCRRRRYFYPRMPSGKRTNVRFWAYPQWVSAGMLRKHHFLGQTLPVEDSNDDHSIEFWWLVGRYLADGWRVQRKSRKDAGRAVICCAHEEADELENRIHAAGFKAWKEPDRTTTRFQIHSFEFYRFLEQFGHRADGKLLPGWVFGLDQAKSKALLDGYISGDGYLDHDGYRITTVSK